MNLTNDRPGRWEQRQRRSFFNGLAKLAAEKMPSTQVMDDAQAIFQKKHVDYRGRTWGRVATFDVVGTLDNYVVDLFPHRAACTCPGGQFRPHVLCKHRVAAILEAAWVARGEGARGHVYGNDQKEA